MASPHYPWWKYGRALLVPLLLWGLVVTSLWEPVRFWLGTGRGYDRASLREWIEEARNGRTLSELAEDYLHHREQLRKKGYTDKDADLDAPLADDRDRVVEF